MMTTRLRLSKDIREIPLGQHLGLIPDANVWLFIYGDVDFNRNYQTSIYSHFLKIAKKKEIPLFTTPVILSEFHNRLIKSPFKRFCQECEENGLKQPPWKSYRKSSDGKEALESASDNISYILEDCEIVDLVTDKDWLLKTSDALSEICGEFNDAYIEKICVDNNIVLVTDDGDFVNSNISIYSANKTLCI